MAVTSVDIDTELLKLAKTAFGVKTNREAIDLALRDIVGRKRQHDAIATIATLQLDRDPATITYGA
ncbi:MAG TPA: type II toxin-antitoxin system VapB family antitoxin [Pseudolysinimonas sp.]